MTLKDRISGPGILRLYLAAIVLLCHVAVISKDAARIAVFIFFILSGFWICRLWNAKYRQCRRPYLVFLVSRAWRIYPIYWACMILIGLSFWKFSVSWPSYRLMLSQPGWIMGSISILTSSWRYMWLAPAWSLEVELMFYFVAPLVIWSVARCFREPYSKAKIGLLLSCFCLAYPVVGPLPFLGHSVLSYMGFFGIGMILALSRWNPPRTLVLASAACAVLFCAISFRVRFATSDWASVLVVAAVVPYVASAVRRKSDSTDRILGDLAFPVYLFHMVAYALADRVHVLKLLPFPLSVCLLTAAGAGAIYLLLDRPLERARKAFVERQLIPPPVKPNRPLEIEPETLIQGGIA